VTLKDLDVSRKFDNKLLSDQQKIVKGTLDKIPVTTYLRY